MNMENETYEVGKRYSLRVKNPGGNSLSYYTGEAITVTDKELVIIDKFNNKVIINRDDISTGMETNGDG
jgi:hypothetical protein